MVLLSFLKQTSTALRLTDAYLLVRINVNNGEGKHLSNAEVVQLLVNSLLLRVIAQVLCTRTVYTRGPHKNESSIIYRNYLYYKV